MDAVQFAALTDGELLTLMDVRHPDYQKASADAQIYLDVFSADRDRLVTKTYLPQGNAEDESDYNKRLEVTEAVPETPKIVNQITGAVFEPDPEHKVPDGMADFLSNADKRGLTHMQVMVDAFNKVLVAGYGVVFVDTTRPAVVEIGTEPMTVAQQKEWGVRVVEKFYDPRNILNWHHDERGLAWVHLLDVENSQPDFTSERKTVDVHLIITRENIFKVRVWKDAEGNQNIERDNPVSHGLQECPCVWMVFLHDKERGIGIGKSFVRTTVRADLAALRSDSSRAMVMMIHGLPQLYRRFSEDEWRSVQQAYAAEMARVGNTNLSLDYTYIGKKIKLGFTSYHLLKGADSEIGYATLDIGPVDKLKEASNDYRKMANEQAGFDAADIWGEAQAVSAESGVAKAFGYMMDLGPQLEYLSMVMAMLDTKVLRMVAEKSGDDPEQVTVTYPQPRMVAPLEQLINEYDFMEEKRFPVEVLVWSRQRLFDRFQLTDGVDPAQKQKYKDLIEADQKTIEAEREVNNMGYGNPNFAGSREPDQAADTANQT